MTEQTLSPMDEHIKLIHAIMSRLLSQHLPVEGEASTEDFAIAKNDFSKLHLAITSMQYDFLYTEGLHIATLNDYYEKYIAIDPRIEEIVFKTVTEFRIRRHLVLSKWSEICLTVAECIHMGMQTKSSNLPLNEELHLATPIEYVKKLTSVDDNVKMLLANPWLPICILLSMADPVLVPMTQRAMGKAIKG